MPYDLELGSDRDIRLEEGGDISLAEGKTLIEQSVFLSVGNETFEEVGNKLTASTVRLLSERIRAALADDEYLGDVNRVEIDSYNQMTGQVSISAHVSNGNVVDMTI